MRFPITPMVKNLLIINFGVFLLSGLLRTMNLNLEYFIALRYVFSPEFIPTQFLTYMFAHADFWHIFGNSISLFVFGPFLEQVWGAKRFLYFYLICGIGAGLLYSGIHYHEMSKLTEARDRYVSEPSLEYLLSFERQFGHDVVRLAEKNRLEETPGDEELLERVTKDVEAAYLFAVNGKMVGASGAIFGILMAFGILFAEVELMLLIPPIPIKAKYFVLILIFLELYLGVRPIPGDNVAHFAHLGGALFGLILVKYWKK